MMKQKQVVSGIFSIMLVLELGMVLKSCDALKT